MKNRTTQEYPKETMADKAQKPSITGLEFLFLCKDAEITQGEEGDLATITFPDGSSLTVPPNLMKHVKVFHQKGNI